MKTGTIQFILGATTGILLCAALAGGVYLHYWQQTHLAFHPPRSAYSADLLAEGVAAYPPPHFFDPDVFGGGGGRMHIPPDAILYEKERLMHAQESFVWADLANMTLTLYKDGAWHESYAVITKGRSGSWWETPAGIYAAGVKSPNHLSSLGGVYMPWSVQFQGNFFIHGWPHYPDGTPVRSEYSGGCIRLSIVDSKRVYEFITPGMPILVTDTLHGIDDFTYRPHAVIPSLAAKAYIAADLANGHVFFEHNGEEETSLGSLTKLMTALVASEHIYLGRTITIRESVTRIPGETINTYRGNTLTAHELLYPLLLEHSHNAASALAAFLGERQFTSLMNRQARSLFLERTLFVDPAGQSEENISTPRDILRLAKYIHDKRRFLLDISAGGRFWHFGDVRFHSLQNKNGFFEDDRFAGGIVHAGADPFASSLSVFYIAVDGEAARPIAIVVAGSENAVDDTQAILENILAAFF